MYMIKLHGKLELNLPSPCRITGRVLHSYKTNGKIVAFVSSAGETDPTGSP